ncbi:MAG: hypothetical protein JXR46_04670 [Calditrichaceae bacterium]|nr:hypothetical protein [Calditrichaceae bacterium]MBN2708321.1 hypothetical protein [Calditrichaceae bacterium]RQV97224.1 MAG: hypothetical protein EH224_02065 [Calditrichota bacterium]
MANNIVIFSGKKDGISPVIKNLLDEIGSLLSIKGYYTEKNGKYMHYHNLKTGDRFMSVFKDISNHHEEEIFYLENTLLNKISLFPSPDLFIFDHVSDLECRSERFCRQIMTLFESRIPVLIIINDRNHNAYKKIKELAPFHFVDLNCDNQEDTYRKLLNLLN